MNELEPPFKSARHDIGRESGEILCRSLGIEPAMCRAITIHWQAGDIPYAEVELFLNEHAVYEIIQLRPERSIPDVE